MENINISISINNIWVLLSAFLVMFMQPGFALVESGFTRSKNTGNILMKNLLDFCIGTITFWLIGYSLMYGDSIAGIIGNPLSKIAYNDNGIGNYANFTDLIFQTVFAATAATIVSGAMAERTKFNAYLMYSFIVSLLIYPISGHWKWGGGWLNCLGFHDFAGSTLVHSLGGWLALTGAATVGPRIGKYVGSEVKAIPGHNLALAALGVFILWFGWFGFNPGSELAATGISTVNIGRIAVVTNLAASASAISAMLTAWIKYKRPTISSALNGALAGLVAITAGCNVVTPLSGIIIGALSGILLIFSIEFFEKIAKIDDPVGAISVHGVCGAFGTILVGIFSVEKGLIYTGSLKFLGVQILGVVAVGLWAIISGTILFNIIKHTIGLRVPKRIEEEGLDVYEHGETTYN